ncbi:ABC transporter ATP-binding protein, partial [Ralstonia pseudosolanacearum]
MTMSATARPTLAVEGLKTEFTTRGGVARAVDDVSFAVGRGEIMGLVGESGSGKSMTGYSIMGLIDPPGRVVGGRIELTGRDGVTHDLRTLPAGQMRDMRGNRIAMIFQDPMMTLNPVLRIDTQMTEAVLAHQRVSRQRAREMAREALARVGIPSPEARLQAYPHQFSGGMRQRVAIAIALLNKPDLIIADEPTTALDVTIQGQILAEVQTLCRESGTALIWITHDLSVVAGLADTVCVMYAGRIVEQGSVQQVLETPRHPYTFGLIASAPSRNPRGVPLRQIP